MSALRRSADDYLAVRRACGYALRQDGRLLASFLDHLERRGASRITVDAALAWATEPGHAKPVWWARRLTVVRGFARYLATLDPDTEVPPQDLLSHGSQRAKPYLYSSAQVADLMCAARRLAHPLRAATFETLIGLMATTGLRTGEVMRLDRGDVDFDDNVLAVLHSKHGKSRLVPLHPTASAALTAYARRRDQLCPTPAAPAFFLSGAGTRLNHTNASTTFAGLLAAAGVVAPDGQRRPRLTDLRHSFAVAALVSWYADQADVPARLPALSAYLGHASPASTYWYLEASAELLSAAADRLESWWPGLS
ncbi:MAG: tyrosine-type recombinase/integrase [Dermatophilaceae bacterium]